jgi:hypothetical protein
MAKIENLVSVGQNRSSKLYFMMIPEVIGWPAESPLLERPMEDVLSEPIFKWLSTGYEAALAIRAPLYISMAFSRSVLSAACPFSASSTQLPHWVSAQHIFAC